MSKLEKRIILFAVLFVTVYIGAIVATLKSRMETTHTVPRLESAAPVIEEEAPLALAELLLPMGVLLALAVCFLAAKKKREKVYKKLDEPSTLDESDEEQRSEPRQ